MSEKSSELLQILYTRNYTLHIVYGSAFCDRDPLALLLITMSKKYVIIIIYYLPNIIWFLVVCSIH